VNNTDPHRFRRSWCRPTLRRLSDLVRAPYNRFRLPRTAKAELKIDSVGLPVRDPGIEAAIDEGMAWLCRAQDHSASHDGGVARHFSLLTGWASSYPETTGYIVPTMLAYAKLRGDETMRQRAKRMLDFLVSIQFPEGGFQGSTIGSTPKVPVIFNTGQILLGLASSVREFSQFREPMVLAADWLVRMQDPDGCLRKHRSPFTAGGEKVYDTHVAWGLLEAARIEPERSYAEAALANVRWALQWQRENGWFDKCCMTDSNQPLTHALGYVLRGIIEAYRFTNDEKLLLAARKTGDGLLKALQHDGFLPGRLRSDWSWTASWACLTGTVQIAHCWLMLYQDTGEVRYRDAAVVANKYVRRTMKVDGAIETRGGIKGSFPLNGQYNAYQYVNWASKFFIDANMLERVVLDHTTKFDPPALGEPRNNGPLVLC
jgi:hypothetical protein